MSHHVTTPAGKGERVARMLPFQAQFITLEVSDPSFYLLIGEKIGVISPPLQIPLEGEGGLSGHIWRW